MVKAASNATSSEAALAEITRQANILTIFNDDAMGQTDYSYLVKSIVGERDSVKISSIVSARTSTTTVTTFVQGTASTREVLLAFKSRLQAAIPGNVVDLPISQLAKSTNIQFSLSVTNHSTK